MAAMTSSEMDAFLADTHLARLATVRPKGRPHVVPMWFSWDGEYVYMETLPNSVKARNLATNPNCALTIDLTQGGLRFKGVILEGRADLLADPEFARAMVDRIFAKYVGEEGLGTPTLNQMRARDHVIIRLKPDRVHVWDDTRSALAPLRNTSAAC